MAHFKHGREITLWISEFIGRTLPGTCLSKDVFFGMLPPEPRLDAGTHRIFMTLGADGGQVDTAATVVVPAFASLADGAAAGSTQFASEPL